MLTLIPLILLSALLPGIQAVREATRRIQCANNLRICSINAMNFEAAFMHFPPGCSSTIPYAPTVTENSEPTDFNFSWTMYILDQEYPRRYHQVEAISFGATLRTPQLRETMQQSATIFRCPSDIVAPILNIGRSFEIENDERVPVGLSNYVGSNGSGDLAATYGPEQGNGMFLPDVRTSLTEIPDGTSNTIMFGERAWQRNRMPWSSIRPKTFMSRAALLYGIRGKQGGSSEGLADCLASGKFQMNFEAVGQQEGLGESYLRRGFSSNHTDGANFAFADGSTRFLTVSIDSDMDESTQTTQTSAVDSLWEQMLSRCDAGEPLHN